MSKNKEKIFLPPIKVLQDLNTKYPGIWDIFKKVEYAQAELGWAKWCYMPVGMCQGAIGFYDPTSALADSGIVAGFAGWRRYKDIFKFDEALIEELGESDLSDEIPIDIFDLLPYPYIYIQRGERDGAIIWREDDIDAKRAELRIIAINESGDVTTQSILHLKRGSTLGEALAEAQKTMESNLRKIKDKPSYETFKKALYLSQKHSQIFLPLILYLCAENAEIAQPISVVGKPKETRIVEKANPRDERLGEVSFYPVGEQFGIRVREYKKRYTAQHSKSEPTGRTVAPHVRRGHYHHYWAGSKKEKTRKLILRWVSPMFIGMKSDEVSEANEVTINVLR